MKMDSSNPAGRAGGWRVDAVDRRGRLRLAARLLDRSGQLGRLRERHRALLALDRELAYERDPQRLFAAVCSGVRVLLNCRSVILGVRDSADPVLVETRAAGLDAETEERFHMPRLNVGTTKRVMADRRAQRLHNPGGDPNVVGLSGDYPPVHSGLVAPIVSPSRTHGWILAIDAQAGAFTEDDERLLVVLAGQLGRIYESASLLRSRGDR